MQNDPRLVLRELLDDPTGAAALARAGRMLQAWRAGGLAAAELEDGWLLDERLAHTPPVDPDPVLREAALKGATVPVRRRLRCRSGSVVAACGPCGGWMVRWEGNGRAWVDGVEINADRWTPVSALPTTLRTPVGEEALSER